MIYSLIGLMGAGKTTFGFELSRYLNYNFIDTDRYIEENENNTISHIFDKYGENYLESLKNIILIKSLMIILIKIWFWLLVEALLLIIKIEKS